MNFFQQGIPLGRWFGITVVIHWLFIIYAAYTIMGAQPADRMDTALFMGLLFATVLLHEFGHALACKAVGGQALHIVLWPLGGIAFVQPPNNVRAWFITTLCGPLVNAVLWPTFWAIRRFALPILAHYINRHGQAYDLIATICILMIYINRLLLLFNLIPAYPMDGGRLLQEIIWGIVDFPTSLHIAGITGTVAGGCFIVFGLGLEDIAIPSLGFYLGKKGEPNEILIIIGAMCMFFSFQMYRRSMEIAGWRKN